jgi:hypothetical protein
MVPEYKFYDVPANAKPIDWYKFFILSRRSIDRYIDMLLVDIYILLNIFWIAMYLTLALYRNVDSV